MARPTKSLATTNRNYSQAQIQAKEEAETKVAALTNSKPKATQPLSNAEKKIFRRIAKINDSFSEADSITLTQLSRALYRSQLVNEAMDDLDIMDERNMLLERRALSYDKAIQQHINALSLPLTSRLRMANDMAKVMIEERKLEQMKAPELKEINPLLGLLEGMKS
jgi:hypothetical protein